ncbi:MAG: hypothetical protein Q8L53_16860 [Aestuariivirga sp.]|nr:hypothetical protein [Aestuariivirga sp.]
MSSIEVKISSRCPIHIEFDPDAFGRVFATMPDEDQIHVLRAMVEHMKPHQTQWDYISIALDKPENSELANDLRRFLFPETPDLYDVLSRFADFPFSHQGPAEGPLATMIHQARAALAKVQS